MKSNVELKFFYPLLLWLITLITGPIIWFMLQFINEGVAAVKSMLAIFFPLIAFSVFSSLSTLLGIIIAYIMVTMKTKNVIIVKFSLWIVTLIGILLSFIDIESTKMYELAWSYSLAVTIAILITSPRKKITNNISRTNRF